MTKRGEEGRSTLKAAVTPSSHGIVWAAGFIDGEGNFCSSVHRVSVPQVQKELLEWLQKMFGGNIRLEKHRPNDIWRWSVYGERARRVATILFPFLSTKRKQEVVRMLNGRGW